MSFQDYYLKNEELKDEICITIDIDWSPQEFIDLVLDLLKSYNVKATFFATHKVNIKNHEVGIHPNFTNLENYDKVIKELMNEFPKTKGARGHRLMNDEKILENYKKFGINYQSNYLMLGMPNIKPIFLEYDIMEIPLFYMDRIHFDNKWISSKGFSKNSIDLNFKGLKVFDFHPIHIFLNTNKTEQYEIAKKYYHEPNELEKFRNKESDGIYTYFTNLLEYISDNKIKTKTLFEIYNNFIKSS